MVSRRPLEGVWMGIRRRARVSRGDATGGMRVGTVRESKSTQKGSKGVKMAQKALDPKRLPSTPLLGLLQGVIQTPL